MISRGAFEDGYLYSFARFNLVIEVLLISSVRIGVKRATLYRFNLVIEVLLISRPSGSTMRSVGSILFQSRNRGSFDFKGRVAAPRPRVILSFNLVIEVLLISRQSTLYQATRVATRFNLVIEVLLISRENGDTLCLMKW